MVSFMSPLFNCKVKAVPQLHFNKKVSVTFPLTSILNVVGIIYKVIQLFNVKKMWILGEIRYLIKTQFIMKILFAYIYVPIHN